MAHLAAHHAGVGLDGDDLGDARPGIDALIGPVASVVIFLEILLGGVEGVGVLHGELPHPDEAAPGPGLVPELGLDLVDHEGVLLVGACDVVGHVDGGFLVGHAQAHIRPGPILEAEHFAADAVPAAGTLPEAGRHGHGEEDLLAVDPVHLLPEDALDLVLDALGGREQGIDAVAHLFHISAAGHEILALDVRDPILIPFAQKLADFHGVPLFFHLRIAYYTTQFQERKTKTDFCVQKSKHAL